MFWSTSNVAERSKDGDLVDLEVASADVDIRRPHQPGPWVSVEVSRHQLDPEVLVEASVADFGVELEEEDSRPEEGEAVSAAVIAADTVEDVEALATKEAAASVVEEVGMEAAPLTATVLPQMRPLDLAAAVALVVGMPAPPMVA